MSKALIRYAGQPMSKRRLPTMNAIRAFESAARLLSISEAARELSVTPTAISHQIRHLESQLGVKLFDRSGRTIQLTNHGSRILPDVTLGMNYFAAAFDDTYDSQSDNTINISTTREFARYWLQPRLGSFYERFGQYNVNIFSSEHCVDLDSNEIDIAIRYGEKNENDDSVYLFQEHYIPVISSALLQTKEPLQDINTIAGKRLIDVRWERSDLNAPSWKRWFELAKISSYKTFQRMSLDAYNLALDSLTRGYGAALLSRTIVESEEYSDIFARIEGPILPGYHYRLIQNKSKSRKISTKHFVEWVDTEIH
ncbi:LysR substrate-binding domain-containing protein [uncultured Pseudoteredinibacter sp.]|uniref:LysR family transcriptional regulator n=1 Tax=uncultured Pseudoteredinibacter sp. TaxID=1641701 RepID=UPI0026170914|nr:LysR substrate-binding domain-containing protein [uncultured Pseudoteredinibacter sp.]